MDGVLGLHHVGLNVADLAGTVERLRVPGFAGDEVLHLTDRDAARGNGLEAIDMQVCFVGNGSVALELIEHRPSPPPVPHDPGLDPVWVLPGAAAAELGLPGVRATVAVRGSSDLTWASSDTPGTERLLACLGLAREDDSWRFPGGTVRLRAVAAAPVHAAGSTGRPHVAFRVGDAAAVHDRLVAAGLRPFSAPIDHAGVLDWFFVRDPGGVPVEVVEDRTD